jgi:ribose-phosphate pyrophosphokinase
VRLLFLLRALKDLGAARLTAVLPYLAYARKDRRTQPRDPVNSRTLAQLLEAVGTDRVLTVDVHNLAAYQNAFRIPAEHLEAHPLFAAHLAPLLAGEEICVVSPDAGGVKRAEAFRQTLARLLARPPTAAFVEKSRAQGEVWGETVVGEVAGRLAVLVDDLVASGTTLSRAARACRAAGARRVLAVATHGVFTPAAGEALAEPALEGLFITDTVCPPRPLPPAVANKTSPSPSFPCSPRPSGAWPAMAACRSCWNSRPRASQHPRHRGRGAGATGHGGATQPDFARRF